MNNTTTTYGMNWSNIDLKSEYERTRPILDNYSSETLLLEINCNVREINTATVRAQFEASLQSKIDSAREIFEDNLQNYVKNANEYRNQD
jgi:hypothetical protein